LDISTEALPRPLLLPFPRFFRVFLKALFLLLPSLSPLDYSVIRGRIFFCDAFLGAPGSICVLFYWMLADLLTPYLLIPAPTNFFSSTGPAMFFSGGFPFGSFPYILLFPEFEPLGLLRRFSSGPSSGSSFPPPFRRPPVPPQRLCLFPRLKRLPLFLSATSLFILLFFWLVCRVISLGR